MKVSVALVAQCWGSSFLARVPAGSIIGDLKVAIRRLLTSTFTDLGASDFLLFPATKNGRYLTRDSIEGQELGNGETRHLQHLLSRELELDDDAQVEDVVDFSLTKRGCVDVMLVTAVRTVGCFLVGVPDGMVYTTVDFRRPMQEIINAIAAAAKIRADGLRLFLAVGRDGEWMSYYGQRSDDVEALLRGEVTDNIAYMIRDVAEMQDAYDLVQAPCMNHIHLLATGPSVVALVGRTRRWTNLLSELRDQERWGAVSLNSIDWGHLTTLCYSESYTQQQEPIPDGLVASVMETIGNVLKVAAFSTDAGGLQNMMMFNVLERVLLQVGSPMKIHSNYCFGSRMVGLEAYGNVDFVLTDGRNFICVMQPKELSREFSGEEEGAEEEIEFRSEEEAAAVLERRKMESAVAQTVMAMEIVNTKVAKTAVGIVSDFCRWTFVQADYDTEQNMVRVTTDHDVLTSALNQLPHYEDVARIVGKIANLVAGGAQALHDRIGEDEHYAAVA